MTVSERMQSRLSKVPGVTPSDLADWVAEAIAESGPDAEDNDNALLYLALAIAYESIASNAAHYFKYTDGEESVDKSNVYANYLQLAKDARKQYRRYRRGNGASQSFSERADRR